MTMTEIKAALEKLQLSQEASDKKILALETALATATATVTEFSAKLDGIHANASAAVDKLKVMNSEAITKLEGSISALDSKIKTSDAKAIEIAARAGVPAVEDHSNEGAKSKADIHAEFKAITNPKARADFYAKHRAELVG